MSYGPFSEPAIDRFRRVMSAIERGEPIPPADAVWFCSAGRDYEANAAQGITMDRALGLIPAPGKKPWWTIEKWRTRDNEIRQVRGQRYADLPVTEAARAVAAFSRRTGLPFPGERRIRTILGN